MQYKRWRGRLFEWSALTEEGKVQRSQRLSAFLGYLVPCLYAVDFEKARPAMVSGGQSAQDRRTGRQDRQKIFSPYLKLDFNEMNLVYRNPKEFDRLDGIVRRTYLFVDNERNVFLSNIDEVKFRSANDIKSAENCLRSTSPLEALRSVLTFVRDGFTTELTLVEGIDEMVIEDPKQDEWGGFGGVYERVEI